MIIRASIANIPPADLATLAAASRFDGTVTAHFGISAWGAEPGATIECALSGTDVSRFQTWVAALLSARGEKAAYVVTIPTGTRVRAGAWLLWSDGRLESL